MGLKTDCIFVILPEMYDPDKGYEMAAIWPKIEGAIGTRYFCGHDLDDAISFVNELNLAKNYTPRFTTHILEKSSGLSDLTFFNV